MEEWKDIIGYEGYYQISSYGQVKNIKTNKILQGDINSSGYRRVILYSPIKKRFFIHRLVAFHFCENYKEDLIVNHKDGNKLNNNKDNLEWISRSQNDLHAFKNNLRKVYGAAIIQQQKSQRRIKMYNAETLELIKIFNNLDDVANTYSLNREYVRQCCKGLYKLKGKYKLEYEELT